MQNTNKKLDKTKMEEDHERQRIQPVRAVCE